MLDELEIEYRSIATLEVRHPERVIDIVAVPYNEPARVFLPRQQRYVTEQFVPGAFNGVSGDVLVNRAHDAERPVGRVVKFHPNDTRGLRTEIRIAKTADGDDILELASERLLGASVGFGVLPGGEQFTPDRASRTITRAQLAHVALTGDPAYAGATVIAVRSNAEGQLLDAGIQRTPTPNLDRVLLELRMERR